MALPDGFLDELRGRLSLARIAERKLTWDRHKSQPQRGVYWACCPFHQEKSASFKVDDGTGRYYCFGCQAKGDMIGFVMETENLAFIEAVERLAAEAGMAMPARDPQAAAQAQARAGLSEIMEEAVRFYRLQLRTARAQAARDYLARRGLTDEALARWEIGFAPGGGQALREAFAGRGIPMADLDRAGLVTIPDDGRTPYDRFRDRIMFPIRDGQGKAIAFGGRAMDPAAPAKYYNSPDTPLFDKGRTLYNVKPAREAAGKAGSLIVAEGYMDVIALVGAGFAHAVAPLGTAITEDQLRLMWRIADEPVIALDGDRAGLDAGMRLIDRALPLLEPGKSLRFATLPAKQDPDDLIRAGGPKAMQAVLDDARPLIDLLWQRETARPVATPEQRAAFDEALRALIGRIAHPGVRSHYAAELRDRRQALLRPARPPRAPWTPGGQRKAPGGASPSARASALAQDLGPEALARPREGTILMGCLNHPLLAAEHDDALDRAAFLNPDLDALRRALLAALPDCLDAADPAAALRDILGPGAAATLDGIAPVALNPHLRPGADPDRVRLAISDALAWHWAQQGLEAEIREAGEALTSDSGDQASWRLMEASSARNKALERAASGARSATPQEDLAAMHLQNLRDRQIWKKTRR